MEPILHSFAYSLDYLREQIADVPDEMLTAQPDGNANHPAWTIGHLVFIAQAIGGVIGIEPWLDEEWGFQFGPGSNPTRSAPQAETRPLGRVSDAAERSLGMAPEPGLTSVPERAALLSALDIAQTKLTAAVAVLTDEQLDAPFPDPSYADVFPSVRHALTQVLLGHTAFHIGQLSIWRRAINLPPMLRSYE